MANLTFQIRGVEAASRGLAPFLNFRLEVAGSVPDQEVHSVILRVQIQIAAPLRSYEPGEKQRLVELFGPPPQWSRTLRNQLWTHVNTSLGGFRGATETDLPVPCSFDLNVASAKYFHALEGGDIPLLFLFSGTVFFPGQAGGLQVQQIPWDRECSYRMPLRLWKEIMELHFPNTGWLSLSRDSLDRLYDFRCAEGLASWEQTVQRLLESRQREEVHR